MTTPVENLKTGDILLEATITTKSERFWVRKRLREPRTTVATPARACSPLLN